VGPKTAVTATDCPVVTQALVVVTVMLVKVCPWALETGSTKTKASAMLETKTIPAF
jgi:hypothetical protein